MKKEADNQYYSCEGEVPVPATVDREAFNKANGFPPDVSSRESDVSQ